MTAGDSDARHVRMVLAYDGSGFHGAAINPGVRTVLGVLEDHLERVLRVRSTVTVAGRTDAGVHARHQVASFTTTSPRFDPVKLRRSINSVLGPELVAHEVEVVDDGFDARFSATGRRYRYVVDPRPTPDPFLAGRSWYVGEPLDLAAMDAAAQQLRGTHDFASFCRRPPDRVDGTPRTLVRNVTDTRWLELDDGLLAFEIAATAFCHQMVRSIVGLLVDIGRRSRRPSHVARVLAARDRGVVPSLAPPGGLFLWHVAYGGDA